MYLVTMVLLIYIILYFKHRQLINSKEQGNTCEAPVWDFFNPMEPVWKPKNCEHSSKEQCPSPCHSFIELYQLATSRSWRYTGLIMGQFRDWILFGLFASSFTELLLQSLTWKVTGFVYEYNMELSNHAGFFHTVQWMWLGSRIQV